MNLTPYAELFRKPGPWCSVYVEADTGTVATLQSTEVRPRNVRRELSQNGADEHDLDAVEGALGPVEGESSPVSRLILVRHGEVELNEVLPGPVHRGEEVSHGSIPDIVPLIRHRQNEFAYVLVQVGHDGGDISLRKATGERIREREVAGSTENIKKVPGRGLAQGQYQHRTEEMWRRNAGDVAVEVDKIINSTGASLIVVAGDDRACQLMIDQLSEGAKELVVTVQENARSEGADDSELEVAVERRVAEKVATQQGAVLERIAVQQGQTNPLSTSGLGTVVAALQEAQVATLVLDEDAWSDHPLLVLDKEPWLATSDDQSLDAQVLGEAPAARTLVRAAALTGADVLLVPSGALADGRDIAALLRWESGPLMPEGSGDDDLS